MFKKAEVISQETRWTGKAPRGMNDHDFDRFQSDDGMYR